MVPFMHCHVCRDIKKYHVVKNDADRILYRLKELIQKTVPKDFEITKEEEFEARRIHYRSHLHFMCGSCHKADMFNLHRTEDKIMKEAYCLYAYVKRGQPEKQVKGKILLQARQLLSGHYPNIAALFYEKFD